MSNWKTHLAIGVPLNIVYFLILVQVLNFNFSFQNILILFLIIFMTPLLPDIDHPTSKLTSWLMTVALVFGIYGLVTNTMPLVSFGLVMASIVHFVSIFFKHRGIIHSVLFAVIIGIIVGVYYGTLFGVLTTLGTHTHLVGDKVPFKIF